MTPLALTALIFGIMLVLMALRTPIADRHVRRRLASATSLQAGWAPFANFLNTQAFARFASYDLSVIPLFILMGHFATQGGISKALFEFASVVMGRFRGGLAMARGARLRRLRRDLRLVGRHRGDDHRRWRCPRCGATATPGAWPPARWPPAARWAS